MRRQCNLVNIQMEALLLIGFAINKIQSASKTNK